MPMAITGRPGPPQAAGVFAAVVVAVLVAAGCSGDDGSTMPGSTVAPSTSVVGETSTSPVPALCNPFLADSIVPIGHGNSAQTDSTPVAGPTGPSGDLDKSQLTYQHLGPGHFGIAISPDNTRVSAVLDQVKRDHHLALWVEISLTERRSQNHEESPKCTPHYEPPS